jgi:hypothetical protein
MTEERRRFKRMDPIERARVWMKAAVVFLALSVSLPGAAAAQRVVNDFRGVRWGTPVTAIPEVAGTQRSGVRTDSLDIFSTQVKVFGRDALAGYYFDPKTGGLLEGAYVLVLNLETCRPTWDAVESAIQRDYPTLVREAHIPVRTKPDDLRVYESDCEYFAFNSTIETWTATYRNPAAPDEEIDVWVRTIERTPRLTVVYRSGLPRGSEVSAVPR